MEIIGENKDQQELEKRKEEIQKKLDRFFKNKYSLILIAILIFSIIINLYFFSQTKNQPLWWDEAEYMSMAKHFAFNIPYDLNPQRPPLFPFITSLLMRLGLNEAALRFFLVVFPSFLVVLLSYFFIKEVYDKKIALLVTFITSVSWIHLFYSMRFMTDSLGLLFGLASFYCFWKGYVNKDKKYFVWLVGPLVALSMMVRLTGALYGLVIFVFLLITDKFKFFKSKDIWISVFLSILVLTPLFIYDYSNFNNALAFKAGYGGIPNQSLGWNLIQEIYNYPELIFFITFIIGLAITLPIFLTFDLIIKKSEKNYFGDIFMILSILITLAFFIYFLRQAENRWLILMSIGIFSLSAKGIFFIFEKTKKINKALSILIIFSILISGAYFQVVHANQIIDIRKNSYNQIKDVGLWIKDNSNPNDVILSVSLPQTIYYGERRVYTYSELNQSDFIKLIKEKNPKYIVVSNIEPHHPAWIYQWLQQNQNKLIPKKTSIIEGQGGAAIYEIDNNFKEALQF